MLNSFQVLSDFSVVTVSGEMIAGALYLHQASSYSPIRGKNPPSVCLQRAMFLIKSFSSSATQVLLHFLPLKVHWVFFESCFILILFGLFLKTVSPFYSPWACRCGSGPDPCFSLPTSIFPTLLFRFLEPLCSSDFLLDFPTIRTSSLASSSEIAHPRYLARLWRYYHKRHPDLPDVDLEALFRLLSAVPSIHPSPPFAPSTEIPPANTPPPYAARLGFRV